MTQSPLFIVSNHHAIGANQAPSIDGDTPRVYHSYFESGTEDQSLFVYHRDTGEVVVYSGDAQWAAFPVIDGKAQGLVLSSAEETWLSACLMAVGL